MNKDIDTAKTQIAAAFNDALTVEAAAEMYYDLRHFVTKAFELTVANINDEQNEGSDVEDLPAMPDCKQWADSSLARALASLARALASLNAV